MVCLKGVDGRVCLTVLSERQGECVRFVRVKSLIPSVGPAPDSIKVCREGERLLNACLKDEK